MSRHMLSHFLYIATNQPNIPIILSTTATHPNICYVTYNHTDLEVIAKVIGSNVAFIAVVKLAEALDVRVNLVSGEVDWHSLALVL